MKSTFNINPYFFLLLIFIGVISCNNGIDYSSPNLDLIPSTNENKITLKLNEKTSLGGLEFKNANGVVSYKWTVGGKIVSKEATYEFVASRVGTYNFNYYAQDSEGKYTNITFVVTVPEPPHVYDDNKVVVGYIPSSRTISVVKWNEITHLIYSFVYPKADGTLDISAMESLSSFVTAAKANNVKILVSVGGAIYPGKAERVFTAIIKDDAKRAILVNEIKNFVIEKGLDGIDIDYEELVGGGATVENADTNSLLPFYQELRDKLPNSSLISVAVTGGYGWAAYHFRDIGENMAQVLDFISVMSYDNLGTWGGSNLGDHSSVVDARGALDRYVGFGVPKSKLVLGVPFYGRDFKTAMGGLAEAVTYSDIITTYSPTSAELLSSHINRDGHNIFFNSQEKISQKVKHVKDNDFRGITIWELGQNTDVNNDLSLLKNILNKF